MTSELDKRRGRMETTNGSGEGMAVVDGGIGESYCMAVESVMVLGAYRAALQLGQRAYTLNRL